jgi:phosphatidylserine/phosphatidylglycerophosphate/cardiolipin synthase-like enzyme
MELLWWGRNVPFLLAAALSSAPALANNQDKLSYAGKSVVAALIAGGHLTSVNKTWGLSLDNKLDTSWLVQTPIAKYWGVGSGQLPLPTECVAGAAGCDSDFLLKTCNSSPDCGPRGQCATVASSVNSPGQAQKKLCTGHSDEQLDDLYRAIIEAESYVDISTLTLQTGRFQAAIRNAFTFLASKKRPIRIRVLYGSFPGGGVDIDATLKELVRDLPANSQLQIHIAKYAYKVTTWNHAKIVAVDSKVVLAGGTNLWTTHYLNQNPMHDMLMRVRGTAAAHATAFLNSQWDVACQRSGVGPDLLTGTTILAFPKGTPACPSNFAGRSLRAGGGGVPVLSVGRLGAAGDNASDDAILGLMRSAKRELWMSHQDVGPVKRAGVTLGSWPEAWINEVFGTLSRGVKIYLVLSGYKAVPGGLTGAQGLLATYSNGYTPEDVANELYARALKGGRFGKGATAAQALKKLFCLNLNIAPIRMSADSTWPDGVNLGNHVKSYMVDGQAFYVGSQNIYWSNNSEFGFIVDDAATTQSYVKSYWSKLWEHSKRAAVSGLGAPACLIK